jgi:Trp operon repressor
VGLLDSPSLRTFETIHSSFVWSMLNEQQKRVILSAFSHVESRLEELECLLRQSESENVLSRYICDLTPAERELVAHRLQGIRTLLERCLADIGITPALNRTSVRWALRSMLTVISVDLADLNADGLARYGKVDPVDRSAIEAAQQQIDGAIRRLCDELTNAAN